MNDDTKTTAADQEDTEQPAAAVDDSLGELHVWREFAEQYGRQILTALIVVTVVAGGIRFYRHHSRTQAEEALTELFKARTLSERQSWMERYPKSGLAPIAKLRLAAAQYAAANYAKAKDAYETFLRDNPASELAPMAQLGLAHSLEASGMIDAALKAFESFATTHAGHFLYAEAVVGKSRCLAQLGRSDEARTVCEDYLAAAPDGESAARVKDWLQRLNRIVKRGPAAAPLFGSPLNLSAPAMISTNVIDLTSLPSAAPAPAAVEAATNPPMAAATDAAAAPAP